MDPTQMEPPLSLAEAEPVKLRFYQQEMLDQSLKRNVIVAMDTGSGKTHIAISRIAEELKHRSHADGRLSHGKVVWFICPSVALCMQQFDVLVQNLPGYIIKTLTGSDGVDRWTTQELWDGFLMNTKVVVCTPKVLEEALMVCTIVKFDQHPWDGDHPLESNANSFLIKHGFVKIHHILLLVFDEAHRCTKASPMNVIMQKFYHPMKQEGMKDVPSVLGLTASPVMSDKSTSLETIEANLDAKAITLKVNRSVLDQYVHLPEVVRISFQAQSPAATQGSPLCAALKHAVTSYDVADDPWVKHCVSSGSVLGLEKQYLNPSTHCFKELTTLSQRATALTEQLGSSAAEWCVVRCIDRYTRREVHRSLILGDVDELEQQHLRKILAQTRCGGQNGDGQGSTLLSITEKVLKLVELVQQIDACSTRVIIFVE